MTTNRLIAFYNARPGDNLILHRSDGTGEPLEIVVALTRDGEEVEYESKRWGSTVRMQPQEIVTTGGAVISSSRPPGDNDPKGGRFGVVNSEQVELWHPIYLIVDDDREASLQDIDMVRFGCPDYEDPEGQILFYDALKRVIAAAVANLGAGSTESIRFATEPDEWL